MAQMAVGRALARAKSLARQGDFEAARALYENVLQRHPSNIRAAKGLAGLSDPALSGGRSAALQRALNAATGALAAGRMAEAMGAAQQAVARYPNAAQAHLVLGSVYAANGAWNRAASAFGAALRVQPTYATAALQLGHAHTKLGAHDAAADAFRLAIAHDPALVQAHRHLADALLRLGRRADAVTVLERANDQFPHDAEVITALGHALRQAGERNRALAVMDNALQAGANAAATHNNIGVMLREMGAYERARAAFNAAISLSPDHAKAHHNLASVTRYTAEDGHVAQMSALLAAASTDDARMHLSFALGKAFDDLGDPDRAFPHFATGNALRRARHPYSAKRTDTLFAKLRSAWPAAPQSVDLLGCRLPRRPIFIVGLPRSGTTLLEQILASHSAVYGAGEIEDFHRAVEHAVAQHGFAATPALLTAIRTYYAAALSALPTDRPVITDKLLSNFQWTGYILAALPEATVIDMRRERMATAWSIFRHYFSVDANHFAYDLHDITHYMSAYDGLMSFYAARFADRLETVAYETLVSDLETETRRVLKACSLSFEPACLEFHRSDRAVATASDQQVRRGLYRGSGAAWRAYAAQLKGHLTLLNQTPHAPSLDR